MKYLSKSNIKYVLVRNNSKGTKAVYDIYDAKDTKSGVHYAEGGLTDSVYKLKSQTIVIDDKGKVVDEKMNGIWLKKNAKPIGSIEKSEIDNMKSIQDWKDHIEGKSKSGDSGLSLNPTRVYKNFYGWVAKTTTKEPIGGYDYEITTMKRYDKNLVSDAQGGKRKSGGAGGFDTFEFAVFQSPSFLLVQTKPKVVNEKRIREQHEEAIEKFKYLYKEGKLTKKKEYAHGGMTDSKKNISRVVLSDDDEKVFVDTPSMAQANEVLYGIWNSKKYSDVIYEITFEDGKEISGSIDLEPHSFHKPHEKKILTWHLLTYYNNVAKISSLDYVGDVKEYIETAKDLVKNYKLYAKGGEVSKKTTYISNRNIESIHAKIKDKKVSLKGSDILDGVYAKNEALNKPFDLTDAYNEIVNLSYDVWDKLGIESGGAIYNSDAIQKKLANEYEKSGVDATYMKYNAAQRREIREMLTDENQHSLRNYFALRGYGGDKEYNDYKNLYEEYIKEKRKFFWNPANIEYQPKKKFEVGGELFGAGHYAKGGDIHEKIGEFFISPEFKREKAKKFPYNVTNREGAILYRAESKEDAKEWIMERQGHSKFAKGGGVGKYEIFRVNEFLYNFEPKEYDKPRGKTIYIVNDEDDDGEVVVEGYDNYDEAISAHSRSKLKGYPIFWRTELETKKPPYVYESGVVLSDGRLVVKRRRGIEVDEYAKGGMTFGGKMHGAGIFGYGGKTEDESDYLWEGYDTSGVNREDLQTLLNLIDSHDFSYDYYPSYDRLFFDMSELNREEQEFAKNVLKLNM